MLSFISKEQVWKAMDKGLPERLGWPVTNYHLKTWQDIVVLDRLGAPKGQRIAEIGGGTSRLLQVLAKQNECVNVDRFAGEHGGPKTAPTIAGVRNITAFLGDFSPELPSNHFDRVISVSVVEHVPEERGDLFMHDLVRVLKPGGLSLHAVDLYVGDTPVAHSQKRIELYRSWFQRQDIEPLGPVQAERAVFECWMASNPDQAMWRWNREVPKLAPQRGRTQSVSLLLGFRKRA